MYVGKLGDFVCRVDELYHFLHVWVPQIYGPLVEADVTSRGFELVESDTELWDEETTEDDGDSVRGDGEPGDLSGTSWEVSFFSHLPPCFIFQALTLSYFHVASTNFMVTVFTFKLL